MKAKSVYLSGPMAGQDNLNEPAFRAVEQYLMRGEEIHEVVVPHDLPAWQHEGACPATYRSSEGSHTAACFLRVDLMEMLRCDEVWVLPGWEVSVGARLEVQVAAACGLPVKFVAHEIEAKLGKAAQPFAELGVDQVIQWIKDTIGEAELLDALEKQPKPVA